MSFTYIGDLSSNRDQVRFHIGDTILEKGPLPDRENFTDDEIDGLLTLNSTVDKAVPEALDAIAARWSAYANTQVGPRREELGEIAESFRDQAQRWREDRGVNQRSTAGARWLTRYDAYSTQFDAGDV